MVDVFDVVAVGKGWFDSSGTCLSGQRLVSVRFVAPLAMGNKTKLFRFWSFASSGVGRRRGVPLVRAVNSSH